MCLEVRPFVEKACEQSTLKISKRRTLLHHLTEGAVGRASQSRARARAPVLELVGARTARTRPGRRPLAELDHTLLN